MAPTAVSTTKSPANIPPPVLEALTAPASSPASVLLQLTRESLASEAPEAALDWSRRALKKAVSAHSSEHAVEALLLRAEAHDRLNNGEKAIACIERGLELATPVKAHGAAIERLAERLQQLVVTHAEALRTSGDLSGALRLLERSISRIETVINASPNSRPGPAVGTARECLAGVTCAALLDRANQMKVDGDFESLRPVLERAWNLSSSARTPNALLLRARAASELGEWLTTIQHEGEGEVLLRDAMQVLRHLAYRRPRAATEEGSVPPGERKDRPSEALRDLLSLTSLRFAKCLAALGKPAQADPRFAQALGLRVGLEGEASPEAQSIELERADVLLRNERFDAALTHYETALQRLIARVPGRIEDADEADREEAATILVSVSDCLYELKEYGQAKVELRRSEGLMKTLPEVSEDLRSSQCLLRAMLAAEDDQLERAMRYFVRSIRAELQSDSMDFEEIGHRLDMMASLVQGIEELEPAFRKGIRRIAKMADAAPAVVFRTFAAFGDSLDHKDDCDLARMVREEALKLASRLGGISLAEIANLQLQLADNCMEMGDMNTARRYLRAAYDNHPIEGFREFERRHLDARIRIVAEAGERQVDALEPLYRRLIRLEKRYGDNSSLTELRHWRSLARHYLRHDRAEDADRILGEIHEVDAGLDMSVPHDRRLRAQTRCLDADVQYERDYLRTARNLYTSALDLAPELRDVNPDAFLHIQHSAGIFFAEQYRATRAPLDLRTAIGALYRAERLFRSYIDEPSVEQIERLERLTVLLDKAGKATARNRMERRASAAKEAFLEDNGGMDDGDESVA